MNGVGAAPRRPAGLLAPFACAALCAAIAVPGIGRASLWWDEYHSLVMARALRRLEFTETLAFTGRGLSP
jgi:hypothetical protein